MTAFAGYLDSRELLLLWDRVVGFDSLEIVAGAGSSVWSCEQNGVFEVKAG